MGKKKKQDKQDKLKKSKKKVQKPAKHDKPEKSQKKTKESTAGKPAAARTQDAPQSDMAVVLRAFGDPHRLRILDLLKEQELSAGELLASLDIVQSTLSHHMKILTEAGIVKCRKNGKWSYYSIDRDRLVQVSEYILRWS